MESTRRPGGLVKFRSTEREECGVIVKNEENLIYILKVPNHAFNDDDYEIHQGDVDRVIEVLSPGETIIGFFHTHLPHHKCEPTDEDFTGAEFRPGYDHLIYKPDTKEICWYSALIEAPYS